MLNEGRMFCEDHSAFRFGWGPTTLDLVISPYEEDRRLMSRAGQTLSLRRAISEMDEEWQYHVGAWRLNMREIARRADVSTKEFWSFLCDNHPGVLSSLQTEIQRFGDTTAKNFDIPSGKQTGGPLLALGGEPRMKDDWDDDRHKQPISPYTSPKCEMRNCRVVEACSACGILLVTKAMAMAAFEGHWRGGFLNPRRFAFEECSQRVSMEVLGTSMSMQ